MQIKYNKMSSRCNSALFCGLSLGLPLPPAICLPNSLVEPREGKGFGQPQGGAAEVAGKSSFKPWSQRRNWPRQH